MWIYTLFLFILIPILLIPFGLIIDKTLKSYNFENKLMNSILIISAFLGNPFSILISYILVSALFIPFTSLEECVKFSKVYTDEYISYFTRQYILFIFSVIIINLLKYFYWSRRKKYSFKQQESLLRFSKIYAIQSIYLIFFIYPFLSKNFIVCEYDFLFAYYIELPSILISGLLIEGFVYYKYKKIGGSNGR